MAMPLNNQKRRHFLKFLVGAPSLALMPHIPGLSVAGSGGSSSNANPISTGYVKNADEAASVVLSMAQEANLQGTFGVGGAIIENDTGKIVMVMHNKVLQALGSNLGPLSNKIFINDPTAHGERQLVYWYYENKAALNLPDPSALTVVTSLDPCAMCAGTLMTSGFNVAVVAHDDFAGVNWDKRADFLGYPTAIQNKLKRYFGYYGIVGGQNYSGASSILYSDTRVSKLNADSCTSVFNDNVQQVRNASNASGLDPRDPNNQMVDPSTLSSSSVFRTNYLSSFPDAFKIRLTNYRQPDEILKRYLQSLVQQSIGANNAVAFIDYYGNLLMASADHFDISPVATAFMTTLQNYSKLRFALVNNPITTLLAQKSLSSPKFGTFVFLYAPDGFSTNTLKDMGAYGSSMEGPIPVVSPSNFQFYENPLIGTFEDLKALISAMPPLYGPALVNISPERVA
ncbi:MAG: nucleoside deaminase [Chitinophagaceae bacterium]